MNQKQIITQLLAAIDNKEFPDKKVLAAARKVIETSKAPKSKKVSSKVKTIQHLITLLNRHHETRAILPVLRCVRFEDGKMHLTDFETWSTFTLPDSPQIQAIVPVQLLKPLAKMKLDNLGEWSVESEFECEIFGTRDTPPGSYHNKVFHVIETFGTRWEANDSAMMTPGYTSHTITQLDTITITTDSGTKTIKGVDPAEFLHAPTKERLGERTCVMLTDIGVIERLARVGTIAAKDESRPVFTCVYIKVDPDGNVTAVAADGFKLLLDTGITLQETCGQEVEFLLPSTPLQNIARTLRSLGEEKVVLRLYNKYLEVITKQAQFIVTLTEGEFPDYTRIIPDKRDIDTTFGVGNAIEAAKEVSEIAADSANISIWNVEKGQVKATSTEKGKALAQWNVENVSINGCCVEIGFNWRYVVDVLKVMDGTVTGRMTTASSPVRFDTEDGITGALMPMHIAEK